MKMLKVKRRIRMVSGKIGRKGGREKGIGHKVKKWRIELNRQDAKAQRKRKRLDN
jgi:hypothetical protein